MRQGEHVNLRGRVGLGVRAHRGFADVGRLEVGLDRDGVGELPRELAEDEMLASPLDE